MTKAKSNPAVADNPAFVDTPPGAAEVLQEEIPKIEPEPKLCGHINRHSHGIDNKPDNLSCTMPLGHTGDHGALHKEASYSSVTVKDTDRSKPRPTGKHNIIEYEVFAYWNDMAGTPVDQIKPPPEIVSTTPLADEDFGVGMARRVIGV
jgi:hypothetical protein